MRQHKLTLPNERSIFQTELEALEVSISTYEHDIAQLFRTTVKKDTRREQRTHNRVIQNLKHEYEAIVVPKLIEFLEKSTAAINRMKASKPENKDYLDETEPLVAKGRFVLKTFQHCYNRLYNAIHGEFPKTTTEETASMSDSESSMVVEERETSHEPSSSLYLDSVWRNNEAEDSDDNGLWF